MILRECLLAANNNLNKPLTNYFVDLFNLFNPTDEELEELQNELGVYAGNILVAVRPLLKSFPVRDGVDDLEGKPSDTLNETLSDTFEEQAVIDVNCHIEQPGSGLPSMTNVVDKQFIVRNENKIAAVETWEDFLFFAAQVFDNKEPWHCFLLLEYVQQFHGQITSERIVQMEPLFKSVVKVADKWSWDIGMFDRLFAAFRVVDDCCYCETPPYSADRKKCMGI